MNILRSRRARLAALTLGIAAVAVPVLGQPASAAVQSCQFEFKSLRAIDVDEERFLGNGDEMIVTLDGERFPGTGFVRFARDGVIRSANSFGFPTQQYADDNPLTVKLFEVDTFLDDRVGTIKNLECTGNQTNQVLVFKAPTTDYRLTYDVTLLS